MSNGDFRQFLKYVYNSYVRDRILELDIGKAFELHIRREWRDLRRAYQILTFIQTQCRSDGDIYETFRRARLSETIASISNGLIWNNEIASESGVLDALDAHLDVIIAGLDVSYIPEHDFKTLAELGSTDPNVEIHGLLYLLKARPERRTSQSREIPVSRQLDGAIDTLQGYRKDFEKNKDRINASRPEVKHTRRWFTGLGKIVTGAALSITDIAAAAGVFPFPVPDDARTVGAIASTAVGVGAVLEGVGALCGE